VFNQTKSNSGKAASFACTTAFGIAAVAMAVGVWIVSLPSAQGVDQITNMLKGVQERYNHTDSLQVSFAETYTNRGRKRVEKGELYMRKPGRMRWEYTSPSGKLFGTDGKFAYSYFPDENRFEKASLKGTEDMRAPLGFLLGKLEFEKEFKDFRTLPDGPSTFITASPKSDKMPYTEVTFLVDPNYTIRWLNVKGIDGSQTDFAFSAEKRNPALNETMFQFKPPQGVIFTDLSRNQ
jgi:outer membrane lipoprotein carrier protein